MNNNELLKRLLKIESGEEELKTLIKDITNTLKKGGRNYYKPRKFLHKDSQSGLILAYMQKHPEEAVTGTDFMGGWFNKKPFVGEKASSRLSELKRWGFVKQVGIQSGKIKFHFKSRYRYLYKITKAGLNCKII